MARWCQIWALLAFLLFPLGERKSSTADAAGARVVLTPDPVGRKLFRVGRSLLQPAPPVAVLNNCVSPIQAVSTYEPTDPTYTCQKFDYNVTSTGWCLAPLGYNSLCQGLASYSGPWIPSGAKACTEGIVFESAYVRVWLQDSAYAINEPVDGTAGPSRYFLDNGTPCEQGIAGCYEWYQWDFFKSGTTTLNVTCSRRSQATTPPPDTSSSSSVPVGAIVGGVVGGLVLAGVLAFFVVRKHRSRAAASGLSTKGGMLSGNGGTGGGSHGSSLPLDTFLPASSGLPAVASTQLASQRTANSSLDTFIKAAPSKHLSDSDAAASPLRNSLPAPAAALTSAVVRSGPPTLSKPAGPVALPDSYMTDASIAPAPATADGPMPVAPPTGSLPGSYASGPPRGAPAEPPTRVPAPSINSSSLHSIQSDPVVSFIESQLAVMRQGGSRNELSTRSSSWELQPEVGQWLVKWEDITLIRAIGRGSYGRVYAARWNETPVACKVLVNADEFNPELALPEATMKELQQEAVAMAMMRHPNIIQFMGLCALPACILTELCSRGSLYDVLRGASRDPAKAAELTWQLRLRMALDAATGLLYLHCRTPQILHRDVKSPNLLVDEFYRVKVCDFGLSKLLGPSPNTASSTNGGGVTNPLWLAPEILNGGRATAASDVFSFGLVLYEMLAWRLPWEGKTAFEVWHAVLRCERPPIPSRAELPGPGADTFDGLEAYLQLMRDCWEQDPGKRPTFADVVPRLRTLAGLDDGPN